MQVDLSPEGASKLRKILGILHGRANATEVEKADAMVLHGMAQNQALKMWNWKYGGILNSEVTAPNPCTDQTRSHPPSQRPSV